MRADGGTAYRLVWNDTEEFFNDYASMMERFTELAPLHAVTCYVKNRRGEWIMKLLAI